MLAAEKTPRSTTMKTKRFGFVLLPDFALLPLSCMVDTLADASYVSERPLYLPQMPAVRDSTDTLP